MCWYTWKIWRLAHGGDSGTITDSDGVWKPIGFGLHWLTRR